MTEPLSLPAQAEASAQRALRLLDRWLDQLEPPPSDGLESDSSRKTSPDFRDLAHCMTALERSLKVLQLAQQLAASSGRSSTSSPIDADALHAILEEES